MENNPQIFIVTGRPRTPRDQGSVENANKLVQRVLKGISLDRKRKGDTVNWTNLLGQIMSVVNSQTGIRSYSASSYQAVFGQRYFPSLRCSVEEMRKCTSIHQRLKMSPDERLEMYVRENDIVDLEPNVVGGSEDEDEEEVDDTNESEGDEIDITTFPDCGFVQPFLAPEREGTARVTPTQRKGSYRVPDRQKDDSESVDLSEFVDNILITNYDGDNGPVPTSLQSGKEDVLCRDVAMVRSDRKVMVPKEAEDGHISIHPAKPSADVQCVDTGHYAPFAPAVTNAKKKKHYFNVTLKEAWEMGVGRQDFPLSHERLPVNEFLLLSPLLTCQDCCVQSAHFESRLIVHEDKYLDSICNNARIWWDAMFIRSFTQLAAHYAHKILLPYNQKLNPKQAPLPQVMHVVYPHDPMTEDKFITFPADVESILCVVHEGLHYAVLEVDVRCEFMRIVVYDGLNYDLQHWMHYAVSALRRIRKISPEEAFECKPDGMGAFYLTFEYSKMWRLVRGEFMKQLDGCNCGPLACSKVIELFGIVSVAEIKKAYDFNGLRRMVVDTWSLMKERCNEDLIVRVRDKRPLDEREGVQYSAQIGPARGPVDPLDLCFCFDDEPHMDVVAWPCCFKLIHKECLLICREFCNRCCECGSEMPDLATLLSCPVIDRTKVFPKLPQLTPMKRAPHWEGKRDLQAIELENAFGTPEYNRYADVERQISQEKKRERQLKQAKDMVKTRAKALKHGGVFPGAVIAIFADTREVSHPVGLLAIIFKTNVGGGVLPATEYGLLSHSGHKKLHYVPDDRYVLRYGPDQVAPISLGLQKIRDAILNNTYDMKTVTRVTIQEYHKVCYGQVSPARRGKCTCGPGGCKTRRCPCVLKGTKCSSSCGCNMTCCNPENGK